MEEVFKGTPFSTADLFATDLEEEKPLPSVVPTDGPNRPQCVVLILQLYA